MKCGTVPNYFPDSVRTARGSYPYRLHRPCRRWSGQDESASIKRAESEKIVPSGHRAPIHLEPVAEVARILHVRLSRTE